MRGSRVGASWAASCVCVCMFITQTWCVPHAAEPFTTDDTPQLEGLKLAVENLMEYLAPLLIDADIDVERAQITTDERPASVPLSPGEQQYVLKRKRSVREALHKLEMLVDEDSVPSIALLGSGGGQRAAVALLGSLHQLGQDGLLDTLLYLGGVSGSGWAMSFLYNDPEWSTNTTAALSRLLGSGPELEDVLEWLEDRSEEDHFSLSDFWGALIAPTIMKQLNHRHLSDEAKRNTTTNPYPVYSALEHSCRWTSSTEGKWFELAPDESGFTGLDRFIPTSQLGSTRHAPGGVTGEEGVKGVKGEEGKEGEEDAHPRYDMDMVSLQGIVGSAFADSTNLLYFLPKWLQNALGAAFVNENNLFNILLWKEEKTQDASRMMGLSPEDQILLEVRALLVLVRLLVVAAENTEDPATREALEEQARPLQELMKFNPFPSLGLVSNQERKVIYDNWVEEKLNPIRDWTQTLPDSSTKDLVSWLVFKLFPLIAHWEWGTTENFLYQSKDRAVPSCLRSNQHIQLIDAGTYMNVPYPPFLGPRRNVELIISLDFSLGDSLQTLILGRNYAAEMHKPFPVVDDKVLEDKDWPKDFYVFPGERSQPTVVYMPLFNQRNCKDAAEVAAKMAEYTTVQWPYHKEKIAALLTIAMDNMKSNRLKLMNEIYKAAARKYNRRYDTMSEMQKKVDG